MTDSPETQINKISINKLAQSYGETEKLIFLGISSANIAPQGESSFNELFKNGIPLGMDYLNRNKEVRRDPKLILENCQTVISYAIYYGDKFQKVPEDTGCISLYAHGRDYHKVLKQKLTRVATKLEKDFPKMHFRCITDSAPFFELFFAESGHRGVIGKNNLFRIEDIGSFVFIGELLCDIPYCEVSDNKIDNKLNCPTNCHKCIKACPTGALTLEGFFAERCISYQTIENKDVIPVYLRHLIGNHIYGCDCCQTCCPFNNKVSKSIIKDKDFNNRYSDEFLKLSNLLDLSSKEFLEKFQGSPIYRIGYEKFMSNVIIAAGNAPKDPLIIEKLKLSALNKIYPELIDWAINEQEKKF